MKVAVCQMEVVARRPDINKEQIVKMMREAIKLHADVAVFSEASIPGYMVGDEWENQSFMRECDRCLEEIKDEASSLGISVVIGTVLQGSQTWEDGRPFKSNTAVIIKNGVDCSSYTKTNLANYREFEDKRHFRPGNGMCIPVDVDDCALTTSICEDGWDDDYNHQPVRDAAERNTDGRPHLHINLSCSPFTKGKNKARNNRFGLLSDGFDALLYINNVGVQNNGKNVFVFDGSSTVYVKGKPIGSLPPLMDGIGIMNISTGGVTLSNSGSLRWLNEQKDPSVGDTITYAIRKFCQQSGIRQVVIALSGGVDSAVSAMLHVLALGRENVYSVNMPTEYNSDTTKKAAAKLASNLGIKYYVVPIADTIKKMSSAIDQCGIPPTSLDKENTQARMRGMGILASMAGRLGCVFPSNGNKAEVTVGYCTMGGDHAGYLSPIADLWKGEVYELARELDTKFERSVLPAEILDVVPSAELSECQSIDDGHGDPMAYWYHDKLFRSWVEPWCRMDIEDSLRNFADGSLLSSIGIDASRNGDFKELFPTTESFINDLERWWKLFKGMGAVKRVQSPPIVVVSRRAFGYDFRESLGGAVFTEGYRKLKQQLMKG